MKKKFISLLLAFLMIVTALPLPVFAQNAGPVSEELVELDYEFERIDGQDYLKVTLPANSVEVVEDPYAIRPMSITDTVPTQDGAGQLINWGAGVLWNDWNNAFPPNGKGYVAELIKDDNGTDVVVATANITTAATSTADMKIDKDTTFQFVTTDDYKVGDDQLSLVVSFPVKLEQNVIYNVKHKFSSGKLNGTNHGYHLVFLAVTRLTSPVYTAEWDTTVGALKPTLKGKLITGTNAEAIFDIFDNNYKYGNIIDKQTYPKGYIDEKDKDGNLIDVKTFDANGSLSPNDVLWSKGSTPVMSGQFLSYTQFENGANVDKPLGNTKGQIPGFTETKFDYQAGGLKTSKYPPYFYNLVGDNDHMWRFQLKEGLEVKFNTGVGSQTQGGQKGQDIGQASTIAYGEKFDSNLKGAFSENTFTLPTATPVAPELNKNNVNLTFKGWKLVQGLEVPVNPQKIETDGDGKQTLTEVEPDYTTTDALKAALSAPEFKGFTGKNPVFYAIFGQTQGKANIKYVDDKGADLLKADPSVKIDGQDYKTEKLGELNETVSATIDEAPQFKGYAINKVEINPANGTYVDPATATIKFVYKVKATTEDKSSDNDYIKVTFDANEGHFGQTTTDKTKDVWVYSGKATFADAKEKVSDPTKDNADFKEWQTAKTSGTKVDDTKTLSTADETFYANYEEKLPGKASVEYLDVKTGKAIEEKNRAEDAAKYPAEKEGKQGEKIAADVYTKDKAPKFVGYEFNRVEISPKDGAYALPGTSVIKVYYNKLKDIIPDDTPDTDDDKPEGYVTVTFKPGEHGTLDGKNENVVYYVNPKLNPAKTMAEITQPTVKANTGYKVADPKWKDDMNAALDTATQITTDLTYIAQYTDGDDVIPVPDPSNPPEKPDGYVTVTFDLDGKGTTTDTRVFFVNPNKDVTLTAPTVTGIGDYKQKTGDDAWNPKFVTKAKYNKDTTFVAQYTFDKDVVPQGPGEDKPVVPDNYVKVTFKEGKHGVISASQTTIFWVNPEKEVDLIEKAPLVQANAEYKHTGWDKPLKAKFTTATDITAKYLKKVVIDDPQDTENYVKVDFKAETNGKIKENEKTEFWVLKDETVEITTPAVEPDENYAFEKWNPAVQTSYSKDKTHNAVFKYTGDDVVPQKPDEYKPDVPDNFVEVVFAEGDQGTIAADATTTYWVNPEKQVTVTAPKVTANEEYKHVAWTYGTKVVKTLESVTDKFTEEKTTITAKYLKKVLDKEPTEDKDDYVKVTFNAENNGKLAEDKKEKSYWVLKDTPVSLTEPTVTANTGWKFIKYEPAVKDSYSEDTVHKAQYKKIIVTEDPKDKDYVKVTFDPADQGTIKAGFNAEVWVLKDETIDPKDITPELDINEKYALEKWDPAVQNKYDKDTKHTAIYKYNGDDVVPQKPGEDKPNVPDDFVKVEFTKGKHGIISSDETTIYWVNPKAKDVTVTAPKVTADPDWKHTGWKPAVKTAYTEATTHIAQYKEKVVTTDPDDEDYVKLTFKSEANGKFADDKTESYVWVLKNTDVKVDAPTVTPNKGYTFTEWSPAVKNIYDKDTTHTAQYKAKDKVVTEDPNDKDYIKVTFNANGGHFESDAVTTKDVWVLNGIATFADAKAKVVNPTRDKAAFKEWQDKKTGGTKVDDGKVLSTENETFYAAWINSDKIIEDPTTPDPKPGYVRLTFDATKDGKIGKNQEKYIDVLAGTKYKDPDLQKVVKKIVPTYKDNTKVFEKWDPDFPNTTDDVATSKYTAQYKDAEKIIDKDPTNPGNVDDKYIRFVFDANTKDNKTTGKIGQNQKYIFDVLKGTRFSDADLQEKINKIVPVAENTKLKFNVWDPSVLKDNTLVENATANDGMSADKTTITYNATYTDKDKIIDVTPGSEDDNPDNGYVRFIFNAVGKDADDAEVQGTVKGNAKYAFDVLKGTKFNDNDLQTKINSLKAVAKDYKFIKWTPDVLNDDKLVEAGENGTEVKKHEYTAVYKKLPKIIEDPTTDQPEDGYVRLTFKAGEGTFGKDAEDKDITQKQIDVLKDTSYTDKDLLAKIKEFEYAAKATDTTKKFNAWSPAIPATGLVAEETFTAQYVDKDKIIDKDPDNPGEVQDGYIRFVFDANTKDNKITGKIGEKQKAIFDVLKGTKFSDSDLQAKINGITPLADNKVFKAWDPAVLNNDTLVENATQADGMSADKTTITYNATYKDKDADIIPGDQDKPDGYVTVRFLTNKNGTLTGQTTYYVNPKAGKKMSDITAPTITANDGYKVATPNWKPEFTDDTPITEDKNFVANYDSVNPSPTTFEINYISIDTKMGKVNTASETVAIDENSANGTITGSTAKAEEGYEFVKWIDDEGTQVSTEAKLVPTARKSATYIAVFKEKTTETTADKVQKLYDFEGVDLAAFVGDELTNEFWKGGVKTTEKAGSTLTDDEKTAIKAALGKATVSDLSERNTDHEVLSPSKGRLEVKFEDNSTIIVEQKLYVYGNGSDKPEDPNQPTPKDKVEVTYKAGDGVENFADKTVMVKKGTKEAELPGKPDAKAKEGFKDLKWTADPAIDANNGVQEATTLTASAEVDHDYAKTTFTVKKVWPAGITDIPTMNFTLYRKVTGTQDEPVAVQGAEVKEITKTTTEATWDNLAKTDSEGKAYIYSVKETFAEKDAKNDNWILGTMETDGEGNNTITNKLKTVPGEGDNPEDDKNFVGKLTITKKLENEPVIQTQSNGMRRAPQQALKFKFKVTGPYGYEETFELVANESKTLENLAYGDYKVEETDSKGYTPEKASYEITLNKDVKDGAITVVNKNVKSTDPQDPSIPSGQVIDVTVKKVWDNVQQGTTTPQVKIELWRKGYDLSNKEYEQKVGEFITAANNTKNEEIHKFENLAKHDPSGRDFTYYAVEPNVPENYTKTENGLTVTNKYEAPPTPATEFTIKYISADTNQGTVNPAQEVVAIDATAQNGTIAGSTATANAGYKFVKWIDTNGTTKSINATYVPTDRKDATYIAVFEADTTVTPDPEPTEFTIKYVSTDTAKGNVSPAEETVAKTGGTITGSTATATTGNKFVKWMDTEGNQVSTDANFVPTAREDATYIAVFEKEETVTPQPTEFTIKYISADTNKGTVNPTSETVAITGGTISGSTATATTGNKFVKWMDTEGNQVSTDANFVPTAREDATYIAVFEKEETVTPQPTDFTIKYISANTDQGTVSPASETVAMTGGTINGSTATAISGYKFVKWIDTNGSIKSTDANFVPTERISATYIAVFEKVGSVIPPTPSDTFTIHYVARYDDMGWVSRDYEVVENPYGDIMGSTAIARNGYRFVKWVDEYGDTVSRFERFVPYERREATYFAIFERDYPYDPYYPDHRPDDRPNRPDDRRDRDDRDDYTERKPGDTRPVLDHEAYMFGYTDGTVRPNGNITRAEAAALVTRLLGIEAYASAAKPNFPDTPSAWYNKAINAAVERGIMKGYPDGRFRPNAPITRAEFTQMISTIDNKPYGVAPFADVVGHWAERPIGSEYQAGRITGYPDGLFRPNAYITRCEAVVILNKIFERKYDELSPINAINAERIKRFIDLTTSFWGYNDMVEATNSHSFKRRVEGRIEEDWVLVK